MADHKMTKQQKAFLESLVCQRISKDTANKSVIKAFENPKSSPGITSALKKGWNTDKQDKVAYYIIKDPADDQPLLFFSLKCGEVHQPLDPDKLSNSVKSALMMLRAANDRCSCPQLPNSPDPNQRRRLLHMAMDALHASSQIEAEDWAKEAVEKQLVDGELPDKAWDKIWRRVLRSQGRLDSYNDELELESTNIIRTKKTLAAVELVHFCAHEPARKKWAAMQMGKSLGRTMFWQFIEPKIREIRELVGCEYLYLFAADSSREGELVKLYQEMGFEFRDDLYVTKPSYDFCCYFMCQEVTHLKTRRNEFFRTYNRIEEAAAI